MRPFVQGQPVSTPSVFTNVSTCYLVLPTHSRWTVRWNNSFLCDGYDSLCWRALRPDDHALVRA